MLASIAQEKWPCRWAQWFAEGSGFGLGGCVVWAEPLLAPLNWSPCAEPPQPASASVSAAAGSVARRRRRERRLGRRLVATSRKVSIIRSGADLDSGATTRIVTESSRTLPAPIRRHTRGLRRARRAVR